MKLEADRLAYDLPAIHLIVEVEVDVHVVGSMGREWIHMAEWKLTGVNMSSQTEPGI